MTMRTGLRLVVRLTKSKSEHRFVPRQQLSTQKVGFAGMLSRRSRVKGEWWLFEDRMVKSKPQDSAPVAGLLATWPANESSPLASL